MIKIINKIILNRILNMKIKYKILWQIKLNIVNLKISVILFINL